MAAVAQITIPAGKVAVDLPGFVVRVDLAHLPPGFWTDFDGGNVRVMQGGDPVPVDVVWSDAETQTGELFFKADLLAASDNEFLVEVTPGQAAPDGTEVWSDYATVIGRYSLEDRTGKTAGGVTVGTAGAGSVREFDAQGRMTFASDGIVYVTGLPTLTTWIMGCQAEHTSSHQDAVLSYTENNTTSNSPRMTILRRTGNFWNLWNSTNTFLSSGVGGSGPLRVHAQQQEAISRQIFVDGVQRASGATAQRPSSAGDTLVIGGSENPPTEQWDGYVTQVYLREGTLSEDWLVAETASWETPESFYDVSVQATYSTTLTIPAGTIATDLTGFVTRVDLADLPAEFWTDFDGGNVRVLQDGNALPTDVVWSDGGAQSGELFFKADLLVASDNVFTIAVTPGQAAPDRTEVWTDYDAAYVFPDNTDRSGSTTVVDQGAVYSTGPAFKGPGLTTEQGLATDGEHWYGTGTGAIKKYDLDWNEVAANTSALAATGIPGVDHFGDCVVVGDELFAVAEEYPNSPYDNQHVTVWDTADLSFLRSYDISAQAREVSGLCHRSTDGHFFVCSYVSGDGLDEYDETLTFVARHTLPSAITKMQGLVWHDGDFYVSSDPQTIYRVADDMSSSVVHYDGRLINGGFAQGLDFDPAGNLWLLFINSATTTGWPYRFAPGFGNGRAGRKVVSGVAKRASWTVGVSGAFTGLTSANQVMASYGTGSDRSSLSARSSQNNFGIWNSSDTWLTATGLSTPAEDGTRHRWHMQHDGTTMRRIVCDGVVRATDSGVAQRPNSAGDTLFVGGEDTAGQDRHVGWLNLLYLRDGVLSEEWLAAEYQSWETPSTFYEVSEESTGPGVSWWDGSALQQGELLGAWDGATLQPAEVLGWWDGSAVVTL